MENNDEVTEEMIDLLIKIMIEEGSLELVGYDKEADEFTYRLTQKCAELRPEIYRDHFAHVNDVAKDLWLDGVIDIIFEEGHTSVAVTEEQFLNIVSTIDSYDDDKRIFLMALLQEYQDKG